MSKSQNKGFTKEEELLLQDFSRNVSTKSSALFYGNALIVSAVPIWLFWRIHLIDIYSSLVLFVVVTSIATYLLALAYKNTKFTLKHKIAVKREEAVTRDLSKKLSEDKKMSKKEKDERILWKKNEVADFEATTLSIFYNNALFLTIVIISSFYLLPSFTPPVNYTVSIGATAGLLALLSTGSQ
ncbi:translocon-associated protein subunit gamma [Tribolium castaneum]|uniref:Translocon-associated protein subunit gamma n=1 Tax=Tribolium castaneum TaxID=7070 RepID=D7EL46_TRICA|nr:translocon-associated protein subunit gamma [Tribolium madens]XP_969881.1 PREDICTED: translocon-associated protein subunit gamma [Tribolium castaneum]EFA11879.1 Translocon-associated protein subunit gamma-like Protein [Tribolium castaneum]|eukprot:XP_969881.1 PREDICTED: translocon-associated protein subunit gamma [Tribolium castaneum]